MRGAAFALLLAASYARADEPAAPSRPPETGCSWRRLGDKNIGLELWVQRCVLGFRRIDFASSAKRRAVYRTTRDDGTPASAEPVIWVYGKNADETPEQALDRLFVSKLSLTQRRHCHVQSRDFPFLDGKAKRAYTIAPDGEFTAAAEKAALGGVPGPMCGDRGESAGGVSYFEFHPGESARRFVFVDAGQEEHPLFDEASLLFLP